jgi:hypothetical protein
MPTPGINLPTQDQLDNMDQGREELQWLPKTLPPHVFVIVSTLPVEGGCFAALHRNGIIPASSVHGCQLAECDTLVSVTQLREDESTAIIERWLQEDCRCLSPEQMAALVDAASRTSLPLCLKLLYDRTRRWRSFQAPEVGAPGVDVVFPHDVACHIPSLRIIMFQFMRTQAAVLCLSYFLMLPLSSGLC